MSTKIGGLVALFALVGVVLFSCGSKEKADPATAAPPATNVIEQPDLNLIKVDKPERFVLVAAEHHEEKPEIHVTGVVNPNIEKSVPVISHRSSNVSRQLSVSSGLEDFLLLEAMFYLKPRFSDQDGTNALETFRRPHAQNHVQAQSLTCN